MSPSETSSSSNLFLDEISADDPQFMELLDMMLQKKNWREDQEIAFEAFVSSLAQHPPDQHGVRGKHISSMIVKKLLEIDYEGDNSEQSLVSATSNDCKAQDKQEHPKEEVSCKYQDKKVIIYLTNKIC